MLEEPQSFNQRLKEFLDVPDPIAPKTEHTRENHNMTRASANRYPNRMGRIILESMEEVLGRTGLNAILNLAGQGQLIDNLPPFDPEPGLSFEAVSELLTQLEHAYGPRGGRGIAMRVGRAAFKYGMREYGSEKGMSGSDFRSCRRVRRCVQAGRHWLTCSTRKPTSTSPSVKQDGKLLWLIERCPVCWERQAGEPVCHLHGGIIAGITLLVERW